VSEEQEQQQIEALKVENESLREQLEISKRREARALARHQQHGLAMETIQQKNEELDRLTAQLERSNAMLRASSDENQRLIVELRELVEQLSTPILQVGPQVLALPIVGALDQQRAATITERTLAEVSRTRARHVIIDLTGTSTVDERTARYLISFTRTTAMLGARCVLCGVRAEVVTKMIALGVELKDVVSVRNLYEALSLTRRALEPSPRSE
jgi:rsbT co-antagonist protein RsbR